MNDSKQRGGVASHGLAPTSGAVPMPAGRRWLIERWITAGLIAGVAMLVAVAAISHWSTKHLVAGADQEKRSHQVLRRISELRSALDEHQSGMRGYVITGNEDFLPLSRNAVPQLLKQVRELRELIADNPGQQQRIRLVENQITERLKLVDETIVLRRTQGFAAAAARVADGAGKAADAIRGRLREMEDEEYKLLEVRMAHSRAVTDRTFSLLPIGTLLSLMLLTTGMFRLNGVMAARQRADEALKRSDQRLRLALEAAEIGEWELNLTTKVILRSPRYDQIFGYARMVGEWTYEVFLNHIHPEDRDRVDRICQKRAAAGGDWAFECRIIRQDGSTGCIWARGAAVRDASGRLVEMLGMVRDVTGQKLTESELRLTTDRFQRALKNSPIVVFNQDLNLRYTWMYNSGLGYDSKEVVGKRDTDIFERAEDAAITEAIKRDVIRSGDSRREEILIQWQGTGRFYDLLVEPLLDRAGEIAGVNCVAVDITTRKQAEAAFEESRNVLALALEAAKFGVSDWNLVTGEMVWSELRKEMSGLPPDTEMDYEASMGTVHPDDRAQLEAAKVRLLETKADGREEFRTLWPDGSVRWLHARGRLVEDAAGTPVRYIGITLDITARKQAEELLARQAAELGLLYATAPVGLFFFDTNLRFVRVNREMAELLGLSAEDHVGRTIHELLPPELADIVEPQLRQVLATGRPVLEYELHGATLPRSAEPQRHWLVSYHPVRDEDGTIRGVHGVVMEITKRKHAEKALRESEAGERARREELEALMDAIPVAIFITRDAHSQHMTANRAAEELLRLPHHGNPSPSAREAVRPDFQVRSEGRLLAPEELPMQRAAAMGVPVSGEEIEIVFPDGEKRNLLGSAFPLFDDSGVVRGCIGAFVDITMRKRRELHTAFLAETLKTLGSISSPADILRQTGRQIAEHLRLDHCVFVEINEAGDQATVLHDHHAADVSDLAGIYHLGEFYTEVELREMAAGKTMVIDDVRRRTALAAEQFGVLGIGSLLIANYVVAGRWKFMLGALRSEPGEWSEEDVGLLVELAERIYLRIERARAEARLSDSEARFRSIFHDAAVPMEVAMPDGRFAQVNRAFCEMLGYSETELLAMTFEAVTHPEDRIDLGLNPLRNLMDGEIASFRAEKRYIHKNGEVVWADLSVSVVRGDDDKPVYFIGQIQDITGRKRAEESLRKSENMLALAIEAGQLGVWNWDSPSRTLVWSERCNAMTGRPKDAEISHVAAMATIHPEERARVHAEASLALETKVDMEMEFRTVWPDTTVRWLQARGRAFYDESGELVRVTGIMQDVTDRRESEDALRRFNNQLESLVDERTEDIKIAMQDLHREFSERRRLEEEILEIGERAQARIGQDLHDDLGQQLVGMTILMQLLSSQLGAESHPHAAEAARLQAFLSNSVKTTRNIAKSLYPVELERGGLILSLQDLANRTALMAGITCSVRADDGFQFEKTAEIHLYRIVQESIGNALKHGKARHIEIECTARDGLSALSVTDDGSGFGPSDEGKWAGMGLHLFQYRARLIGARLTVTRGENGGCRVICSMGNPS